MRYILVVLLVLSLSWPSWALADGSTTRAANPQQDTVVIVQSAIPFIKASSGTMGNNGAISAMTATARTYSNGAYIWLPAGAIAAGVPAAAAWYWFIGSSTTAGTVYNSTYTSGVPVRGTATAFSTTGPGAFTGSTATVTAIQVTVPANTMGPSGRIDQIATVLNNTTGGNKVGFLKYGTGSCWGVTFTTQASYEARCSLTNRGVTNVQAMQNIHVTSAGAANQGFLTADATNDSTTDLFAFITINSAVATDVSVLETYKVTVTYGP